MPETVLVWRDELNTSFAPIDREHRRVVALAGALQSAIAERKPAEELADNLSKFADCMRQHFINEEGLMLASGYAEYEEHRKEHLQILDQLNLLTSAFAAGYASASQSLGQLIRILTEQHIVFADKRLGNFLTEIRFPES